MKYHVVDNRWRTDALQLLLIMSLFNFSSVWDLTCAKNDPSSFVRFDELYFHDKPHLIINLQRYFERNWSYNSWELEDNIICRNIRLERLGLTGNYGTASNSSLGRFIINNGGSSEGFLNKKIWDFCPFIPAHYVAKLWVLRVSRVYCILARFLMLKLFSQSEWTIKLFPASVKYTNLTYILRNKFLKQKWSTRSKGFYNPMEWFSLSALPANVKSSIGITSYGEDVIFSLDSFKMRGGIDPKPQRLFEE